MEEEQKRKYKEYLKKNMHEVCRRYFRDNVSELPEASIEYVDSYNRRDNGQLCHIFHAKVLEFTEGDEISEDCYTDPDFDSSSYKDRLEEQEIDVHIGANFDLSGAGWA